MAATITVSPAGTFATIAAARTGSAGAIDLPLEEQSRYVVAAAAPGYRPTSVTVARDALDRPVSLEMDPLTAAERITVSGVVRTQDGQPVAGAVVLAGVWIYPPVANFGTFSDDAGRYRIELEKNREYSVVVFDQSHESIPIVIDGTRTEALDLIAYARIRFERSPGEGVARWVSTHSRALADVADVVSQISPEPQIIALGESSHGGRGLTLSRLEIVQELVRKLAIDAVAVEISLPEATALNRYVMTGSGDVRDLVAGLKFWITKTEEFITFVEWLRSYNASAPSSRRVRIFGIDMQFARYAAQELIEARPDKALESTMAPFLSGEPRARIGALSESEVAQLLTSLQTIRERLLELPGSTGQRLARFARVLAQLVAHLHPPAGETGEAVRERAMAENALWLLETNQSRRMVLWAANSHVARQSRSDGDIAMGRHLADALGERYVSVALLFGRGQIRAWDGMTGEESEGVIVGAVNAAPGHFFEAAFRELDQPRIVSLRAIPKSGPVADWFHQPRPVREYGALFLDSRHQWSLYDMVQNHDAVVYIPTERPTTPAPKSTAQD